MGVSAKIIIAGVLLKDFTTVWGLTKGFYHCAMAVKNDLGDTALPFCPSFFNVFDHFFNTVG
jgi:hypothetical protein